MPRTTTAFAQRPCARLRSSHCVVGDLTARLWRPYGDPTTLFQERPGIAKPRRLFLAYSKCESSFGVLCDLTASIGDAASEMLAIVLRAPRRSAFFWTPFDRRENAVSVWQWFKRTIAVYDFFTDSQKSIRLGRVRECKRLIFIDTWSFYKHLNILNLLYEKGKYLRLWNDIRTKRPLFAWSSTQLGITWYIRQTS